MHGIPDLSEQQALCRVLQLVRDDPTLQARVERPVEKMTLRVDPVREVMPDARCLEVMTHHGARERSWEEGGGGLSGDPNGELGPSRTHDQCCGWSVTLVLDEVGRRAFSYGGA